MRYPRGAQNHRKLNVYSFMATEQSQYADVVKSSKTATKWTLKFSWLLFLKSRMNCEPQLLKSTWMRSFSLCLNSHPIYYTVHYAHCPLSAILFECPKWEIYAQYSIENSSNGSKKCCSWHVHTYYCTNNSTVLVLSELSEMMMVH